MYQKKIRHWFLSAIQTMPESQINSELRNILAHEKHSMIENFLGNLAVEFPKLQATRHFQGKSPATNAQLEWLVKEMTAVFVHNIETKARLDYESDLKRLARKAEADKIAEYESTLEGNPIGEFAEAGVITNEALDLEREESL